MENNFEVGENVIYPHQGMAIVKNIENITVDDQDQLFYVFYIESNDMIIKVPSISVERLGIRKLVTETEARNVIDQIAGYDIDNISDWKQRHNYNSDLIKKSGIFDIAKVVKTLFSRNKLKDLPVMEKKLFDLAWKQFIDELSKSLKKEKREVEKELKEKLKDS